MYIYINMIILKLLINMTVFEKSMAELLKQNYTP